MLCLALALLVAAPTSPNALRNSSFLACANPGNPDWWGTGGASQVPDWKGHYGTTADAPFAGVRSLRLVALGPDRGFTVQSHAYQLASGRDYAFSIYLKGDSNKVKAALFIGNKSKTVAVTDSWQRHVFTAKPDRGHWAQGRLIVNFGLAGGGTLWAAAPQLEAGTEATAWRPADADSAPAQAAGPVIPANAAPLPSAACPKLAAGPKLTGKLDDPAWAKAALLGDFKQVATGAPARVRTTVSVLRDDAKLYLGFRCQEPDLDKLVTKVTRRDGAVFADDSVEVFLQPNPKGPDYFHFAVNAAGVQFDEQNFDAGWNGKWEAVAGRGPQEWYVELAIPFATLELTPAAAETWGLLVSRNHPESNGPDYTAWSVTYSGYHVPDRFGKLTGFAKADMAKWYAKPKPAVVPAASAPPKPSLDATFELSYYTSEPIARLWVKSTLTEPVRVELPAGPLWLRDNGYLKPGDERYLRVVLGEQPLGAQAVKVTARDADGNVAAEVTVPLVRLAPNPVEVKMQRVNRYLIANGKPLLVYAQGLSGLKDWWLEDVQQHGFNTVITGFTAARSDADLAKTEPGLRALLDECLRRKLHVIVWLHPGAGPYPPMREAVVRTINKLKDHPAILLWYLVDEPEGWWESQDGGKQEADLVDLLQAAKQADPYRPAHINWYAWSKGKGGYGTLDSTEIGSLDRYPVGRGRNAIWVTDEVAAQMNDDCRPRHQPTAFWVQQYGYDDAVREPTPAEEAGMTYTCYIDGMRLVYYFIYKPMSVELWESMIPLGKEVEALQPVLCDPSTREVSVGLWERKVRYGLYRKEHRLYLLAVNASDQPATVKLDVATPSRLRPTASTTWFGGPPVTLNGTQAVFTLAANQHLTAELR